MGSLIKMVVLNDRKIKEQLYKKNIRITPFPYNVQFQPASVDLRLDNTYLTFKNTTTPVIDTKKEQFYTESHTFSDKNPLIMQPNDFILAQTVEKVKLPNNILGRVEGRSSLGRLGIVIHVTAGFIDPGFEGNITLEISNIGNIPVILYPNQRICQIVFEELSGNASRPYGSAGNKYQGQSVPTPSTIFDDMS